MFKVKLKTFLVVCVISIICGFGYGFYDSQNFIFSIFSGFFSIIPISIFIYLMGIDKKIQAIFEKDYYEQQEEINFQKNLRREVERKRALLAVDNESLHYQNQLKIEYIAQVAQIQLQSNQYLANVYQQAIINNSTKNEISAQKQLLEIEAELKKQGLI